MDKNRKADLEEVEEQEELSSKMDAELSTSRSVFRIVVAIFAFIWFLAGGSVETVISLSGGAMGLSGLISFFLRNPITFLIIGIIQVVLGLILFIFSISLGIVSLFHFLWSIRWFYGYYKYRNIKPEDI
ncbi:MAG: hypothetical protein LUQ70_00500 [Methanobacteriaceae archaeon]|nr:hypothetical protein [Methanobacteriaceae archaeon]